MYWIDVKYVGLLSSRLTLFKVKTNNPYSAVCRCPYCGDSKKNVYKTRGYFFQRNSKIRFFCHNCGISKSISTFIKDIDPLLKREYDLEIFAEKSPTIIEVPKIEHEYLSKTDHNSPLKRIKKISQLPSDHPAKLYVLKRKIPFNQHFRLYYAPKFFSWTNSIIPDKFDVSEKDEPRLVIPFFDKNNQMFGYQGRSFNPNSKVRYYTIMTGEHTKVFGLDQVNLNERVYVVEGPIDSLFIPNCLAMAGSDLNTEFLDKNNTTIIFDNEKRNTEIIKKMRKMINMGYTVCIWPDKIKEKDINDMIMSGININNLLDIINESSYKELEAKLRFAMWRKS